MGAALDEDVAGDGPVDPAHVGQRDRVGQQIFLGPDGDGAGRGIDRDRIAATAASPTQPSALADRDQLHRVDPSNLATGDVDRASRV